MPLQVTAGQLKDRNTPEAGAIDHATPTNVQPVGKTGYTLVFSDEFAGTTLNTSKWATSYPDTSFWNGTQPGGHLTNTNEPQAYDPSGISFPGGSIMRLTMSNQVTVTGLPYTSGMVTSYPSFNPIYGYFEARMKLADVNGSWPAFWMDPTDQVWPPEIDWMELFGKGSFNTSISSGFVRPAGAGNTGTTYNVGDTANQFRTYGGEWRNGSVAFYCDGNLLTTYTGSDVPSKAMYLICNLAGQQGTSKPIAADLPFSIDVDYIRAWA